MKFFSTNFNGDPNLGMYGFATSSYVLLGSDIIAKKLDEILGVEIVRTTISGTNLVGLFSSGNSEKIIVSSIIEEHELKELEKRFDVFILKSKYTAVGNMLLMNDKGCLVSPLIKNHLDEIKDFLGVKCEVSKIAGLNVVGSAAVCNNKSCIVHPNTSREETEIVKKTLGTNVGIATANFGSPFLGACVLINDNGIVVSEQTTGPELSMIDEVVREVSK